MNNSNIRLYRDSNKVRKVQNIPSVDEFSAEVNRILKENPVPKDIPRKRPCQLTLSQWHHNMGNLAGKKLRREAECRKQFFTNPVIKNYLMRREVEIDTFGIPQYCPEERIIYDFLKSAYIPFRNPTVDTDPTLFSERLAYLECLHKAVLGKYEKPQMMLAFNLMGCMKSSILIKNKIIFDKLKFENELNFK